jgi:CheY-like chemotaxis protein
VAITFASEDYTITAVDNGEDAVVRARDLKPDVILADAVMPRRNGYEVCEAIKADPSLKHIPVLLLAGTFEAFDEGRARAASADGHLHQRGSPESCHCPAR